MAKHSITCLAKGNLVVMQESRKSDCEVERSNMISRKACESGLPRMVGLANGYNLKAAEL